MKNIIYILLLFLLVGCKSTKEVKNNKLDIISSKKNSITNIVENEQLQLDTSELTLFVADPKKPITVTDEKGNKKKYENVEKLNIKKKNEAKTTNKIADKEDSEEKLEDNSTINEKGEAISDTNNFKGIAIAIAFVVGFALIGYLVFKFKR
ncbi:hypothetical protein [Polaribacter sp. IC073]|uniref:hypothetical protein n=1 Tax=Polaribacter sp. IC073 TaxID=2508540 RepID=UPI0011BF0161|nr:hypothetical protein [Polaribacter sp. IC073]TXD47323.1 hypothetical protein ES045_12050 [Polaribacter sp. IC073]